MNDKNIDITAKKVQYIYIHTPNIYYISALTSTELFERTAQLIFFDTSVHKIELNMVNT